VSSTNGFSEFNVIYEGNVCSSFSAIIGSDLGLAIESYLVDRCVFRLYSGTYITGSFAIAPGYSLPYAPGSYNWDNVGSNTNEDGSVGVYVPSNAGSLPGVVGGDTIAKDGTFNPPYALPTDGTVSIPDISNPSIGIGDSVAFPGVANPPIEGNPDIPIDKPLTGVLEWLASCIVPSATYFPDKFNYYIDKLGEKFPINVDDLKNICVNGSPLPDFKATINGREYVVFKGQFANSIAPTVRTLVGGFTFIFLIFYNYSEVYRLIRGTRPFSTSGKGD